MNGSRIHDLHVGDIVSYHAKANGPVTSSGHRVRQIAIVHDQVAIWITGITGYLTVRNLSKPREA
jgi:hypothetical protein